MLSKIIKGDPLVKILTGKSTTTRKRKVSRRKKGLTASEKRIVSALKGRKTYSSKKSRYKSRRY